MFSIVYTRLAEDYCQQTSLIVLKAGVSHQRPKVFSHHPLTIKIWRGTQVWFVNDAKSPGFWNNRRYFQAVSRASTWLVADVG
jgi:hypothetical protein